MPALSHLGFQFIDIDAGLIARSAAASNLSVREPARKLFREAGEHGVSVIAANVTQERVEGVLGYASLARGPLFAAAAGSCRPRADARIRRRLTGRGCAVSQPTEVIPERSELPLPKLAAASALSQQHPVWLCDVWGVVPQRRLPEACDALIRHRHARVVYCSSPAAGRRWWRCSIALVPSEIYDRVVSSGDVTRGLTEMRAGQSIFHLGPDRDPDDRRPAGQICQLRRSRGRAVHRPSR